MVHDRDWKKRGQHHSRGWAGFFHLLRMPGIVVVLPLLLMLLGSCTNTDAALLGNEGSQAGGDVVEAPAAQQEQAIEENPDQFIDQRVSVEGEISEVVTNAVFLLEDPELLEWDNMLVIHEDSATIDEGILAQVTGTVRRGDDVDLEAEMGIDQPDFENIGQDRELVIMAERVVNLEDGTVLLEQEEIEPAAQQEPTAMPDQEATTATEAATAMPDQEATTATEAATAMPDQEASAAGEGTEDTAGTGIQQQPTAQPTESPPETLPETGTVVHNPMGQLGRIVLGFGLVVSGFILLAMMHRRK